MISLLDHSDDSEFSTNNKEVTDSSSRNQEKKLNYNFKFSLAVGDRGKTIKFQNLFFEIINILHQIYFFQSGAKRLFDLIQFGSQKNWSVLVIRTRFYFFRRKVNNFRRSLMSWFYHTNNFDKVIILTFIIFLLIIFMWLRFRYCQLTQWMTQGILFPILSGF